MKRIVVPGGPYQYYAVHQYSVVRRVWGASGVYKFLIFAPPTPPQNLIAGILSAHVRCILGAEGDAEGRSGQVQIEVPTWEVGRQGEVGSRLCDRAGEQQGVWGRGQVDQQGGSPSGPAQGNRAGQEGLLQAALGLVESPVTWVDYFLDEPVVGSVVGLAAESAVESAVDEPHFRLKGLAEFVRSLKGVIA